MKSFTSLAAALAVLSYTADAFWRMECQSRSGLARIDPVVQRGVVGNHAHAIHGGSNFGMSTTYEDLMDSKCTSCRVTQDNSAYWSPSMHFIYANGTTVIVPQIGGMLAYYLLFGDDIKAFPAGFQMISGDVRNRNFSGPVPDPERSLWTAKDKSQFNLGQKALGFNCMNYAKPPEPSISRHFLPDKAYLDANCADGIRTEIFFPSCWNGKDNDSPDHKSHMAYPDLMNTGTCPPGFETRVPSLFFETIWDTSVFTGVDGQFMFSNGDPTGYGYHGDFVTGWDVDFLQQAINTCTNPSGMIQDCPLFNIQTEDEAAKCKFEIPEALKGDDCVGPAPAMCGNPKIQPGPGYADPLDSGETGTPTSIYIPETTLPPVVPTASYKTVTGVLTDKFGGGINIGAQSELPGLLPTNVDVPVPKPTVVAPAPVPVASAPAAPVVAPAPGASSSVAPVVDAPAPTLAPVAAPPAQDGGSIISTSTYTSAGIAYEVAIEEVTVYVTVEAPAAKMHRRHHHLHRRDREHGLLGRH
ncbi:hypothetical protein K504DRAFT_508453 [Pleomassaria siparia CBS 279.74]|uniref:DUF1996 domain-containing protein n=1 Tax=Pleomassaria siparia CBS 279.74 TaxID=1314801 RepID=A0A6G1JR02_9PLEO|nr:hypothetical protein K504DRAFT_508453 [Pleomassaria siparia CBS 279.74]